jgi:hypothetical protein
MYSEIIKLIEAEQVKKRNILLDRCSKGVEEAIKSMDNISAALFVKTLFDTTLSQSVAIVNAVKFGKSIYDAYTGSIDNH